MTAACTPIPTASVMATTIRMPRMLTSLCSNWTVGFCMLPWSSWTGSTMRHLLGAYSSLGVALAQMESLGLILRTPWYQRPALQFPKEIREPESAEGQGHEEIHPVLS